MLFKTARIVGQVFVEKKRQYCNEFRFRRSGKSMGVTMSHHHWVMKFITNCAKTNRISVIVGTFVGLVSINLCQETF